MKRVLVTGATGFIGRHALPPLIERGYEVHAVSSRRAAAVEETGIVWHRADLFDPASARAIVAAVRPSHLLHMAWYVETGKFWHSPENVRWVEASLALLRAFADEGGQRVVMAGTCAEYDWTRLEPCVEYLTPLTPATLYGTSKHALHLMLAAFASEANLSYAWGRIFSPYGPGEHPRRLVASVIVSLLKGEPARCSPGDQLRDFLHTQDVAVAFVALLESDVTGPVNVGSGQPLAIKEVVWKIAEQLGRRDLVQLGVLTPPPHDPPILVANVERLHTEVGWTSRFDMDEGIADTIAWWEEHA